MDSPQKAHTSSAIEGADKESVRRVATCPNCLSEISGPFCATCGQEQKNLNRYIWTLAGEAMDEVFRLDSRVSLTLFALLFKPGYLTTEYFAGRRARYIAPVRLYLIISFLFFFVLPILPGGVDGTVIDPQVEDDQTTWQQEIQDGTIDINIPSLSEEENKKLEEAFKNQIIKAITLFEEDPGQLFANFMDVMSAVMFFLLPVFAVFLQLFYLGSGFYYAEHLLLAIHNHCFLYIAFLLITLLEYGEGSAVAVVTSSLTSAIQIWVVLYMYLSLKHAYAQGYFVTFLKFTILATSYWILAMIGLFTTVVLGVWMI